MEMKMLKDYSTLKSCSPVQKRSILKIAIELVKADNRIHSKEISVLDDLQEVLGLTQEELDLVHYIPLSDAVASVREMDRATVETVLGVFNSLMRIDSDIDYEENLLLAAVTMSCLPESRPWTAVLSVPNPDLDFSDRQIAFLEKSVSKEAHAVLDDKNDLLFISKAFGDVGLRLFYLPNVLGDLGAAERFGLLKKSMSYLMPAGDMLKVDGLKEALSSFDSKAFFKVVCSRLGQEPAFFPFEAFLLVKIRGSVILDDDDTMHSSVDFFCLDISSDVKDRILSFVSLFGDSTYLLPYDGYYKLLFDYFSAEAKINSEICLDRDFNFTLPSLGGRRIPFESSPQARTLYLLLLKYGREGIRQEWFNAAVSYLESVETDRFLENGAFNLSLFEKELLSGDEPWRNVIFDTVLIYRSISTKDDQKSVFLSYIASILAHRSSLKTYLNKGFDAIRELSDKGLYLVSFDKDTNAYRVSIGLSMFRIEEGESVVSLSESRFWKALR